MLTPAELAMLLVAERNDGSNVIDMRWHRSLYSTSFPIDEVTVSFADGSICELIVKDLSWESLLPTAHRTKPRFLHDPRREIGMYEQILDHDVLGTARLYGASSSGVGVSPWLVLEKVPGLELYQVGQIAHWCATARWLAHLHDQFSTRVPELLETGIPLIRHDAAYYRQWIERAHAWRGGRFLEQLVTRYDEAIDRLTSMPVTLLHGECYASNVIVAGARICPIDWEMAALGPGLTDLAALVTGNTWKRSERDALVRAYCGISPDDSVATPVMEALDVCRLHLAVQWLGWAEDWVAPTEHAHDWFAEARDAAERLELC